MKSNNLFTQRLFILLFFGLITFSCKKNSEDELTPEEEMEVTTASVEAETESESKFDDLFDNVMGINKEVARGGTGLFDTEDPDNPCFTVTTTYLNPPHKFPVRIVIDFGNGCVGKNGRTRYGKIVTEYTGRLTKPGGSATTTLENYRVDSTSIEGTQVITNTSSSNQEELTIDITDATITKPNGNYHRRNSHRVFTQVEGNGTPEFAKDDVFAITGYASGEVQRRNFLTVWKSTITEPLHKRFRCKWFTKGIVEISRRKLKNDKQWNGILNYGDGEYDRKAILTVSGKEREIIL